MIGRAGELSVRAGILLSVPAIVAWLTGLPFVFPSLGPTAYLMATAPGSGAVAPRRVIGGHAIGTVAGLASYHLFARGLVITADAPMLAGDQLWLVASGVVAVVLTTAGMIATRTGHAPACATTLIVALGLLPTPTEAGIVVVAVVLLTATHRTMQVTPFGPHGEPRPGEGD